jgi:putative exporter of polyketide antibiotics
MKISISPTIKRLYDEEQSNTVGVNIETSEVKRNMKRKHSIGWVILAVVLGALMGSALGQVIGLILPDGVVKQFFLRSAEFGTSPVTIDMSLISFTFGFTFEINIIGVIGIILAAYILRWYV